MFLSREALLNQASAQARPPRLSLCMIVRDNQRTLAACLESIRPWVDELIVVDTGSQDATCQIARRFDARVFEFPWCDDFSAARNQSLRLARGEWLFWMDSDDTISAENGRRLHQLAYGRHDPDTLGYVMQVHCPGTDGQCEHYSVVDQVKLVRRHEDLRFEFRIHEQLLPAIRRLGGKLGWTDIHVIHSGADQSAAGRQKKCERDLRILALELAERPDHPFVLFNLGMTYEDMGQYQEACGYLRRCLELSDPGDSHVRKAYALLVNATARDGGRDQAWQICQQGRSLFPDDVELAFRQGMLAHELGRLKEAEEAYRVAIANREPRHFASVDRGLARFKARHNLALVYRDEGRLDLAESQCRQAIEQAPRYAPTRRLLVEMLLNQRRLATAELEIERCEAAGLPDPEAVVLRSELAERKGDLGKARSLLKKALKKNPESSLCLDRLCQVLFHHGPKSEAERMLLKLVRRDANDAAARYNLGTLYYSLGRHADAEAWLRESVRLRPESAPAWVQLARVLSARGIKREAKKAYNKALAIAPDATPAKDELRQLRTRSTVTIPKSKTSKTLAVRSFNAQPQAPAALRKASPSACNVV